MATMQQFKYLLFTFFVGTALSTQAQSVFAPAGAEWYHNMYYGLFHSFYAGDTVINGTNSRKVVRIANNYLGGPTVYDLPPLYFYSSSDTVFVFNNLFHKFTPLYIFNVADGDTVTLPILPTELGTLISLTADSTFTFIVDSVRIKLFDTAHLKTIYTRSIGFEALHYLYSYGGFTDSIGCYVQKLGSIETGFLPYCRTCAYILSDSWQMQDTIRCYHDSTLNVRLVGSPCDPSVAVSDVSEQPINIFPNPAINFIHITLNRQPNRGIITIDDATGKTIQVTNCNNIDNILDISALPTGVYILKLESRGDAAVLRTFTVVK
jgi:Secretion system C-terminal sorting domain